MHARRADSHRSRPRRAAYRALERMIVTLELAPGSVATEGALIERARARPHAGARGDPAARLGRAARRAAARRARDRAAAPRRLAARASTRAAASRSCWRARRRASSRATRPSSSTTPRSPCRRRWSADDVLAFLEADKALDEALALAADNPFAARLAAPLQTHSRRFWFRYGQHRAGRSGRAPCRADPRHSRRRRGPAARRGRAADGAAARPRRGGGETIGATRRGSVRMPSALMQRPPPSRLRPA